MKVAVLGSGNDGGPVAFDWHNQVKMCKKFNESVCCFKCN